MTRTTKLNAYLHFHGNCREAMSFYQNCLGGELDFMPVGDTPGCAGMPDTPKDHIMHACLSRDGMTLMASDMGSEDVTRGKNVSLCIDCATESEIHTYFSKLAEGGKVRMPPGEQFWGAIFGDLTDKFGIHWMLNYNKSAAPAKP